MSTSQDYILDHVSIDYIRLATFDFQLYLELTKRIRQKYTGWRPKRWLQYKCQTSQEGVTYGIAEQNGRAHGIFEGKGIEAHILAHWFRRWTQDALYCTRIDLQATKTRYDGFDWLKLHKRIAKPKKLILGDDGNTLYIGNRESDSFWRLYQKEGLHVRLEVELKGNQAKRAWNTFRNRVEPSAIFATYAGKSRVPKLVVDFYANLEDATDLEALRPLESLEAKLDWFMQLDGLAHKLAKDHDTGERFHRILKRWAEYCEK